jgi:hypothetical protein
MSFQAYLDAVKAKTGHTPEELKVLAEKAGVYHPDMKAGELVAWTAKTFNLGHGHTMSIWVVWKEKGWVKPPRK